MESIATRASAQARCARPLAALLLLGLTACGASAPSTSDPAPDASATAGDASATDAIEAPAAPSVDGERIDVAVELTATEITARVTAELGGFLSLLGADGTFYQLEIPPNAVLSDLDVTMTEVGSIAGSGLGDDLVAGVRLEPAGLVFLEPAVLTLVPAVPVGVHEEGPFSAASDGGDLHLYPLDPDPAALRMTLLHFSLYGVLRTEAEARANLAAHLPSSPDLRLEVEIGRLTAQAREAGTEIDPASLARVFDEYRDATLKPMLVQATIDDRAFVEATQRWVSYHRQRTALRVPLGAGDIELMTAWEAAYRSYLERQVERCYRHEVGGIVDLLKIRRVVEILAVPAMSWEAGSMERMQKCATFTLEMRSSTQNLVTTCVIGAGRIDETANVFATVEITPLRGIWDGDPQYGLEDAEGPWVGPMEWGAASHEAICQMISSEVAECTSTMVGYGDADEFTVVSLDWDLNLTRYTAPEDQTQARLALRGMVVQPGDPELEYESDCETGWTLLGMEAEGETAPGPSSWRQTWRTVTERMPCRHRTDGPAVSWGPYEDPEPTEAWYLDCWTMEPHGDVVAVWEQEGGTSTLGTSWEETRFVLRHTPRH